MNKSLFLFDILILLTLNGICQNITADTTLANTYIEQAKHFIKTNNNDSSNIFYNKASDIYLKLCQASRNNTKQDTIFAERYLEYQNQIGKNLQSISNFDSSLKVIKNSISYGKLLISEKNKTIAHLYQTLGRAYFFKWMLDSALESYSKSLRIKKEILGEKHAEVAIIYNNIGLIYFNLSEFDKVLECFTKELEINRFLNGEINADVAAALNNIGVVYMYKAEYDKALIYSKESLEIKIKLFGENHLDVATSYLNLGNLSWYKGQYEIALEYFFKSLAIRKNLLGEKSPEVALCYNNIGNVFNIKAEYEKAKDYYFMSLEIRREFYGEKHPDVAMSYNNIGNLFTYKLDYHLALEYYFKSLEIKKELIGENNIDVALAYNNIGDLYACLYDYDKALEYTLKALTIRKELFGEYHPDVASSYKNLANIYFEKNDYDNALLYYFKDLSISKQILGIKNMIIAMGYYNIANVYSKMINQSAKNADNALMFYHLGISSSFDDFNDTSNVYALPVLKNYLEFHYLLKNLVGKAEIFANKKIDFTNALKNYQLCDTIIDQTRRKISQTNDKIALGAIANQVYSGAINVCLNMAKNSTTPQALYYKELAFNFSEKNKGMVLLEALAGQESLKFSGLPDSLLIKEHTLKTDITFFEKQLTETPDSSTEILFRNKLFKANREYEELITMFEKQFPDYYNLKYTTKTSSVKDVQNIIDKQTALRSYFVGDSVIYIFTITKKELNVVQIPKMENFDDSLKHFRYGLTFTSQRMKDYYRRLGYSFYQQLFPDVLDKNIQNIIIVPDGNLGIIPFESLLTTDYSGDIDNYKDYPYLIKKYNISYSYSANLFAKTFSKDKTKDVEFSHLNDWLAFAPVFSDENKSGTALLSRELRNAINKSTDDSLMTRGTLISGDYINPLPGTEQETQNIFNLFNQKNKKAQLLLYDKASENYLKSGNLNQYRIIHFATHGFVNSEKPELSGIILNQDTTGGEDGILYSGELYNLKMNADLVVLSACETGLGKIRKGEGIIGLTRALLYAGAKNIVVSLWQVSDRSTSDLMIDFYKNITENEKQNHSKSLQQAKLKMISEGKYAHPFYWSPFILIGK